VLAMAATYSLSPGTVTFTLPRLGDLPAAHLLGDINGILDYA
jgi:hypothetical protein